MEIEQRDPMGEMLSELEIAEYIAQRLREEGAKGTLLMPEYVGGDTREDVEESIKQAIRMYQQRRAYFDGCLEANASVESAN